jgi:hypothetical protein
MHHLLRAGCDPRSWCLGRWRGERRCRRCGWRCRGIDGDESGEVFVFGAETVERPGTERGANELSGAGVELGKGLRMGWEIGGHRVDDAEVVGMFGDVGEEAGDPQAASAMLFECPFGSHQIRATVAPSGGGCAFAGIGDELGLVVKSVHMGRSPLHAKENDVLGLGWMMRRFGGQRSACAGGGGSG